MEFIIVAFMLLFSGFCFLILVLAAMSLREANQTEKQGSKNNPTGSLENRNNLA